MIIKDWKRVFRSMYYFFKLIFVGKKYDVVFVSSTSFNRGENGENTLFKPLIEFCNKNNLSYIAFEDTAFGTQRNYKINNNSIPFDFITIIQIILRKIYHLMHGEISNHDQVYFREKKISKIIRKIFFRKFSSKVFITLIWNNVTLWRCINPIACVIDYQHAFIFDGEDSYINNGRPPKLISDNNVVALVHGPRYKNILMNSDKSNYYNEKNVITVGLKKSSNQQKNLFSNNKKILFTLQLTPDFQKEVNKNYAEIVEKIINSNANFLSENNYEIILRHHPRYVSQDCPDINTDHDFVRFENEYPISDLFNDVSLHMTFNSNSAFDAAVIGIPTVFINMHEQTSPSEMFLNQYQYPSKDWFINDYEDLKTILTKIDDKEIFSQRCKDVYEWSKEFYHDFDEKVFGAFLLNYLSNYKHKNENESY